MYKWQQLAQGKDFRRMFASTGFFGFLFFSVLFVMVISHKPLNQLSLFLETG
jgi:hypothetical protein